MLAFRVCSAVSGDSFTVRMDMENFKITVFKSSLATFTGICPSDQILLIGPPYKILDSHFGPDMCSSGQKIFMFDKKIISDVGAEPLQIKLKPYSVPEPSPIDPPTSHSLIESSSPLLRAVPDYETQFLTHIRRGEAYLLAVEQAASSCKRCFEQIEVQRLSLDAAISNLNDHYAATKSSFEGKQQKIIVQQQAHKCLLDSFDENFQQLGEITLHPSLQSLLTAHVTSVESGEFDGIQSNSPLTLRDTIPVEKEFAWRDKCLQSHQKVEENMTQLQVIFDKIAVGMDKISIPAESLLSQEQLRELSVTLENNAVTQKHHMEELRQSYTTALEEVSKLLQCDDIVREEKITDLFTLLETFRKNQEQSIKPMDLCCSESMEIKDSFAEAKRIMSKNIFSTLRAIASVQTDIQFKLKKGMELMTRWRQGHNGYFQHLERIRSLPEAYATFLHEMIRRREYTEEFEMLVKNSVDAISEYRSKETSERERFMANMGSCLPPVFFDIVPSLVEKPPFFNATITDRQDIPDVRFEDVRQALGLYDLGDSTYSAPGNIQSRKDQLSVQNNSVNDESGATLTSSSSGSAYNTMNCNNDTYQRVFTEKDKTDNSNCERSATSNVLRDEREGIGMPLDGDQAAEMFAKITFLEQENRQLRQLAHINLQSKLLVSSSTETPDVIVDAIKSITGAGDSPPPTRFDSSIVSRTLLHENLDTQLASLLIDVLKLKEKMNVTENYRTSPTPQQVAADFQVSDVASVVNELHSLAISARNLSANRDAQPTFGQSQSVITSGEGEGAVRDSAIVPKISFLSLNVGDIALFLPTNKKDTFLAFAHELPYYYLSQDSLANFKNEKGDPPNYIMGQIIFIDERIASKDVASNIGSAQAPKVLPDGMKYYLLEVVAVEFASK